jgi:hypothetical protein
MLTGFILFIKKYKKESLYFLLFVITSLPFVLKSPTNNQIILKDYELFDKNLSRIKTVDQLVRYNDSLLNGAKFDTLQFVESLCTITKLRFRHGLANYSLSDNWIAYFTGKLFWDHFAAIVDADDILEHSEGLCSQQTIVFLEALKRKGIQARSVGLGKKEGPGHFLAEVNYLNSWHIYDVSIEPDWSQLSTPHKSMDYYKLNKDSLFMVYKEHMPIDLFNTLLSTVDHGKIGEFPAKRMHLFHTITKVITLILPFLFLVFFLKTVFNRKKRNKSSI